MESKEKVNVEISRGKYVESHELKHLSFKRVLNSFKFSFDGLKYAYLHEQSLLLHVIVMVIIIGCGIGLNASPIQWVIILVMGAMMVVAELFNTSIEAVVDMITGEYHPLAKIAKDTASAACFVVDIIGACMWLAVFAPKIVALFR